MLPKKDDLSQQLKLCKEGWERSIAYKSNKGLPLHLKKEGMHQAKFYRKRMMELLKQLYGS